MRLVFDLFFFIIVVVYDLHIRKKYETPFNKIERERERNEKKKKIKKSKKGGYDK